MRVLLIGEYSSLYNNLATGLKELGHDVVLANDGDGFKNYHRDIDLSSTVKNKLLNHAAKILKQVKFTKAFAGYDVAGIMNPLIFSRFGPYKKIVQQIKENNGHLFLTAAGDDYYYWQAYNEKAYRYSPHAPSLKDYNASNHLWENAKMKMLNDVYVDASNEVIANAAEYYIAYKEKVPSLYYVPFPIPVKNIGFQPVSLKKEERLKIFHGVQTHRKLFKGSDIVDEAMADLVKKYPHDIEYQRVENVPYATYINSFNACHVLIDQLHSYSPAMNALTAMAKGKVVIGGFEEEARALVNYDKTPLINVTPDKEDLKRAILSLLDNRAAVEEYSYNAREYTVAIHDETKIAQQYINIWS